MKALFLAPLLKSKVLQPMMIWRNWPLLLKLSKGSTIKKASLKIYALKAGKQKQLRFRPRTILQRNKHSKAYKVTVYKMELKGEGTEEKPFLIGSVDDFKKFVKMHPAGYYKQTCDLDLSGLKAQTGGAIVNVQGDPFKGHL